MTNSFTSPEQKWVDEVSKQIVLSKLLRFAVSAYLVYYVFERLVFSYNLGSLEFGILIISFLAYSTYKRYSKNNRLFDGCDDITTSLPANLESLFKEISKKMDIETERLKIYCNIKNHGISPFVHNKNNYDVIVLPLGYFKLIEENREDAKIILAHELSHVKQKDASLLNFTKIFLKVLAFLIPFNIIYGFFFISIWYPYLVRKDENRIFGQAAIILLNKVHQWNKPDIKDAKTDTLFFIRTDSSQIYLDYNHENPPKYGRSRYVLIGDSISRFAAFLAKKLRPHLNDTNYVRTLPDQEQSDSNEITNTLPDKEPEEFIPDTPTSPKYIDMEEYIPNPDTSNKIERVIQIELGKIRPLPKIKVFNIKDIFLSILILFLVFMSLRRVIYNSERVADYGAVINSTKDNVVSLLKKNSLPEIKFLNIFQVNPTLNWRINKVQKL